MATQSYSRFIGFVYIFNLIVGTGALAIPQVFAYAGWLISSILLCFIAFFSFLTATLVIEAMASANACLQWKHLQKMLKSGYLSEEELFLAVDNSCTSERSSLLYPQPPDGSLNSLQPDHRRLQLFQLSRKVELGQMASMFFNKLGINLFYICIIVYLFGDLAIYAVAVPKTLRNVACDSVNYGNMSNLSNSTTPAHFVRFNGNHQNELANKYLFRYVVDGSEEKLTTGSPLTTAGPADLDVCWKGWAAVSRRDAYLIFLALFSLCTGPFLFFNMKEMLVVQVATTVIRWAAFFVMVIMASIRLFEGKGTGRPAAADLASVPSLFGVAIYAFMCHHSLPGLIIPIRDKQKLGRLVASDMLMILVFYLVLCVTAAFSFAHIFELYTLNFQPQEQHHTAGFMAAIEYFLALFPVFTLTTNFPIIGITLRENIITLCQLLTRSSSASSLPPPTNDYRFG